MSTISIGDIGSSRAWLSIERRPLAWWRWCVSFGPRNCGTVAGVFVALPWLVLLGHVRTAASCVRSLAGRKARAELFGGQS